MCGKSVSIEGLTDKQPPDLLRHGTYHAQRKPQPPPVRIRQDTVRHRHDHARQEAKRPAPAVDEGQLGLHVVVLAARVRAVGHVWVEVAADDLFENGHPGRDEQGRGEHEEEHDAGDEREDEAGVGHGLGRRGVGGQLGLVEQRGALVGVVVVPGHGDGFAAGRAFEEGVWYGEGKVGWLARGCAVGPCVACRGAPRASKSSNKQRCATVGTLQH